MPPTIRLAAAEDAEQVQTIYEPVVRHTATSFEVEPPSADEMRRRIVTTLVHWPWLVCEHRSEILGYAYGDRHRVRAAYQWSVDVSVYVREQVRRAGVGRALYSSLFKLLALQG